MTFNHLPIGEVVENFRVRVFTLKELYPRFLSFEDCLHVRLHQCIQSRPNNPVRMSLSDVRLHEQTNLKGLHRLELRASQIWRKNQWPRPGLRFREVSGLELGGSL